MDKRVSVLIAAHNAEATIRRAIRSAVADPATTEIIVVDDASQDSTFHVATSEAERDNRVRPLATDKNAGPAAARNRGLDAATGTHVAILDSDDFFLPDRLGRLLTRDEEMVADNILFTNADKIETVQTLSWDDLDHGFSRIDLSDFVAGNLRQGGQARGELGFLKPLMSLSFLNEHGLRYDEQLRLGEDYDLYVRIMLAGGRMTMTQQPGYAAVLRSNSLSASHKTETLGQFATALTRHLEAPKLSADARRAMLRHRNEVRGKWAHRRFLDLRRAEGSKAAIRFAAGSASRMAAITMGITRDKLGVSGNAGAALPNSGYRLLRETDG